MIKKLVSTGVKKFKGLMMFAINRISGIESKKAVFISFDGKSYSDNPKVISERLHELDPEVDIVWAFNDPLVKSSVVPDYVRTVRYSSLDMIKELATSKVWVDNCCKPLYTYKSKKQFYVQTWHGDRGFKKTRYDSSFIPKGFKILEEDITDLAIAGSEHASRIYKSAMGYKGEILMKGTPRNDILVEHVATVEHSIKKMIGLDDDVKVLLFAPTLRRKSENTDMLQEVGELRINGVLEALEESTDNKWVCLVRAHLNSSGLAGITYGDKVINVSDYEDMADLLVVSDMMITDYSSTAGDFALRGKPLILFHADRAEYMDKDRKFNFDINKTPYMIAFSQEELVDMVKKLPEIDVVKNCDDVLKFYGTHESGDVGYRVARRIIKKMAE